MCGTAEHSQARSPPVHINIKVGGKNNVSVRLLAVEVKGHVTIKTDTGSDGVLLVDNDVCGKTTIMTAACGDDLIDVQHNTFQSDFNVGTSNGGDLATLYDNVVHGHATFEHGRRRR